MDSRIIILIFLLLLATVLLTSFRMKLVKGYIMENFVDICSKQKSCKKCLSSGPCGWSDKGKCILIPQNATGLILEKANCPLETQQTQQQQDATSQVQGEQATLVPKADDIPVKRDNISGQTLKPGEYCYLYPDKCIIPIHGKPGGSKARLAEAKLAPISRKK